tara:strand:- start:391 stop:2193 length:1803 start_codon:yes stop_codon:yes gene_type:complete
VKYRAEIDGLRALAVVPVILFHAGFELFSGGYLGVDIFFVISGYLISSIIFSEVENNNFSIIEFYVRRTKRIVPLLLFVIFVFFFVFWGIMLPWDFENYGAEAFATIFFSNNFFHFLTSGNYWGTESEFKALIHTWSLGIEEQFYIIFPLFALAMSKIKINYQLIGYFCLFFASLYAFFALAQKSDMLVYFMSPFRAWELLAGILLARFTVSSVDRTAWSELVSLAGIGLVAASILLADSSSNVVGIYNFYAVVGTVMIIAMGSHKTFVGKILSSKPFVGVGLISFSLYVWHQPIFVAYRLTSLTEPKPIDYLPYIILCVALSLASWHFIENFFRRRLKVSNKRFITSTIVLACSLSVFSLNVFNSGGISSRWDNYNLGHSASSRNANVLYIQTVAKEFYKTEFPSNGMENVLVIGNSFAREFINAATTHGYFRNHNVVYNNAFIPNCMEIESLSEIPNRTLELLQTANHIIFPSGDFSAECAQQDMEFLVNLNDANVVIVGTKNFGWSTTANIFLAQREGANARVPAIDRELNESNLYESYFGEKYVNTMSMLIDAQNTVPILDTSGNLLSFDTRHLTPAGASFLGQLWFEHPLLKHFK